MDVIVGTAGHIDHGKTSLIKALTGVDADRLPEEQERGITIDLGFAELNLEDVKIGFVDVPGHERFVKNMLAGASGIDLVLLVVAADEGVMPQTREHFEICRLLGIKNGIIVLTKTDLVEDEFLDLVKLDVDELVSGSFLDGVPVVEVSAKTLAGVDRLKETLRTLVLENPRERSELVPRLPIDRAFTIKGFGTVVTGTLSSGELRTGSDLELQPLGQEVRVRGIQTHGRSVDSAAAGQRTAINLSGINHNEIERGLVLGEIGTMRPTQIIDAEVEVLQDSKQPIKTRQRVRVHIGTAEVLARVQVLNKVNENPAGRKRFCSNQT